MYEYDLNEILFMSECHNLSGFIEGLETAKHLLDVYNNQSTKKILQEIIDISGGRKMILCKKKYSFLTEDQQSSGEALPPADPSQLTHGTSD